MVSMGSDPNGEKLGRPAPWANSSWVLNPSVNKYDVPPMDFADILGRPKNL